MREVLSLLLVLVFVASAASAQTLEGGELQIQAEGAVEFDSNMVGSNADPVAGARYSLAPSVRLRGSDRRLDYDMNWRSRFVGRTDGQPNRWSHEIRGSGGYYLGPGTRAFASNFFNNIESFSPEDSFDEERTGQVSARDFQNSTTVGFSHQYQHNLLFSSSLYYRVWERENPRFYDGRYWGVSASGRYRAGTQDTITFGVSYDHNNLLAPEQPVIATQTSSTAQVATIFGTWRHSFSRSFHVSVRIGPTLVINKIQDPPDTVENQRMTNASLANIRVTKPDPTDRTLTLTSTDGSSQTATHPVVAPVLISPSLADCPATTLNGVVYRSFIGCSLENPIVLPSGLYNGTELSVSDTVVGSGDTFLLHDYEEREIKGANWQHGDPVEDCPAGSDDCTTVWYPNFEPDDDDPFNTDLLGDDGQFNTGSASFLIGAPTPIDDLVFKFVADISAQKRWSDEWDSRLSYTRRQDPDANGGGETSVDRLASRVGYHPNRWWTFQMSLRWRYRRSTTATPTRIPVAGVVLRPDGSVAYGQSFDDFLLSGNTALLNPPADPNDLSNAVPGLAGFVEGRSRRRIDVHTVGLGGVVTRRLSRYATVSLRGSYRHQISQGVFYRSYDRYSFIFMFNYQLDPVLF